MTIAIFPEPSTAAGPNAKVFVLTDKSTQYEIDETFLAGGYTVTTSPATAQVNVVFVNASSILANDTTTSGTVSFSIASNASQVYIMDTNAVSSTVVTITNTASNISGSTLSGTLDEITTTGNYNQTGLMIPVVVAGGGGGANSGVGSSASGGGGGAGAIAGIITYTNAATTSIIVGAIGNAPASRGNGNAGGITSFGNILTVNGGNGGNENGNKGNGGTFTAGTGITGKNGGVGGDGAGSVNTAIGSQPNASGSPFIPITGASNGGGGGGAGNLTGGVGAGSGIGTGGNGGKIGTPANAASGFGAGGGGGAFSNDSLHVAGKAGSPGKVFVLRGF